MFSMSAFSDELVKIAVAGVKVAAPAQAGKGVFGLLGSRGAKILGIAGAGGLGTLALSRAIKDYQLGRQVRQQMEESQGA